MADELVHEVATPNEAYSFFKERTCKLCKAILDVEDKSIKLWADVDAEYLCIASCSSEPHYRLHVGWTDPKHIEQEDELFNFEFNNKHYTLVLYTSASKSYYNNLAVASIDDNILFKVNIAHFLNIELSEESIVKRIETINLLK